MACSVLAIIAVLAIIGWLNSYEPLATEFVPLVQALASIATVLSLIVAVTAFFAGARSKRIATEALQESYAQMVGVTGTSQRFSSFGVEGNDPAHCPTGTEWGLPEQAQCDHSGHDVKLAFSVQNNSPYPIHNVSVRIPGSDVWERVSKKSEVPTETRAFGTVLASTFLEAKVTIGGVKACPDDGPVTELVVDFLDVEGQRWLSSSKGAVRIE